jgi:carboxyl-terminal processing protease
VTPRGKSPYTHPVVVLVDHWTGSMGEGLAIGFDAAVERATIVGTPMAGLLGATERFELPQSHIGVNIPTEKLFCVDGTPREAFRPRVLLAVEDLQQGRDPWIQKGLHVLKERTKR